MWETQSSSYHLGMVFVSPIKKSDVGMVYEWVYQIIYSVMVIIHESIILILLSYLYISGIIMLDDHNPWKKKPKQPVFEGTTEGFAMANLWDFIEISLDHLQKSDTISNYSWAILSRKPMETM